MAFSETNTILISDQWTMIEQRWLGPERVIEKQLPGSGLEQVLTPDDLGDPHRGVIDHHGEVVGWNVVVPPHDEITKIFPGHELLRAIMPVREGNGLTIRNAEPPVDAGKGPGSRMVW